MPETKILPREHVGWNACRTVVVALCDDLIDKNPELGSQFASGMRTAAKRISDELATSQAEQCPVLLEELRKRWNARRPQSASRYDVRADYAAAPADSRRNT